MVRSDRFAGTNSTNSCKIGMSGFFIATQVLVRDCVAANRVDGVMLFLLVEVKADKLFPANDHEGRVQGVEFSDLDVPAVLVAVIACREANAVPIVHMRALGGGAGGRAQRAPRRPPNR